MHKIQEIASTGNKLRKKNNLRTRLPLNKISIVYEDIYKHDVEQLEKYSDIIQEELNVKNVEFLAKDVFFIQENIAALHEQLDFNELKNKYSDFAEIINTYKTQVLANKLDTFDFVEKYKLEWGKDIKRLWIPKPDITGMSISYNGLLATIILDTTLSPELTSEGLANDTLRFIQDTRKTTGLDVSDRIVLEYGADDELSAALETHGARVMADALITEMKFVGANDNSPNTTEIENHKFSIRITKI